MTRFIAQINTVLVHQEMQTTDKQLDLWNISHSLETFWVIFLETAVLVFELLLGYQCIINYSVPITSYYYSPIKALKCLVQYMNIWPVLLWDMNDAGDAKCVNLSSALKLIKLTCTVFLMRWEGPG